MSSNPYLRIDPENRENLGSYRSGPPESHSVPKANWQYRQAEYARREQGLRIWGAVLFAVGCAEFVGLWLLLDSAAREWLR